RHLSAVTFLGTLHGCRIALWAIRKVNGDRWSVISGLGNEPKMTRDAFQTVLRENMNQRPQITSLRHGYGWQADDRSLARARAFIFRQRERVSAFTLPHVLPMLTMTGIDYLEKNG